MGSINQYHGVEPTATGHGHPIENMVNSHSFSPLTSVTQIALACLYFDFTNYKTSLASWEK